MCHWVNRTCGALPLLISIMVIIQLIKAIGYKINVKSFFFWVNKESASLGAPLEFFFEGQSYSSLHSGRSLAWDHVCGNIDDPSGAIAISAELSPIPAALSRSLRRSAAARSLMRRRRSLCDSLNIIKHSETHVKHCETS